jgi:phage terminase small subunit
MSNDLTEKEILFIHHYLSNNFNAKKAATSAGYSEVSAHELGHRLLKKVEVKKAIDSYLTLETLPLKELTYRLGEIARNRGSDYIREDGSIDLEQLEADGLKWLVKRIRKSKNGKTVIELYDSQRALEALAKVYGLVDDGTTVTVNVNERIEQDKYHGVVLSEIRQKLIPQGTEMSLKEYFDQIIANRRNTNELEAN